LPKNVIRTAQYAQVPMKTDSALAPVNSDMRAANDRTKIKTTAEVVGLAMSTRESRKMGTSKVATAMDTAISFATILIR